MTEQNKAHAAALRQVAEIYENAEADLNQINLFIHTYDKQALINTLKAIGGKFTKKYDETWLRMESQKIPGLTVTIWRDTVCRKTVTYDCESLLSPEEEGELMEAVSA